MGSASVILSCSWSRINTNSSVHMRWTIFAGIGWKQLTRRNRIEAQHRAASSECRAAK